MDSTLSSPSAKNISRRDRSGDQGNKAAVDLFRGAVADHEPNALSGSTQICSDRNDQRIDGRRASCRLARLRHETGGDRRSIQLQGDLVVSDLNTLDHAKYELAQLERGERHPTLRQICGPVPIVKSIRLARRIESVDVLPQGGVASTRLVGPRRVVPVARLAGSRDRRATPAAQCVAYADRCVAIPSGVSVIFDEGGTSSIRPCRG